MSHLHEEPRLTAYALGELSGAEQLEIEALLARDARARTELEEVRDVSSRLERELSGAHGPALSARRRASVLALMTAHGATPAARGARWGKRRARLGILLAALVPAGAALLVLWRQSSEEDGLVVDAPGLAEEHKLRPIELRDPSPAPGPDPSQAITPAHAPRYLDEPVEGVFPEPPAAMKRVANESAERSQPAPDDHHRWVSEGTYSLPLPASRMAAARPPAAPRALAIRAFERPLTESRSGAGNPQRESYDSIEDNPFVQVSSDPRSTFSIDVDTAAYALMRRFLDSGSLPPRGAVRIEELINYFSYRYPQPSGDEPVSVVASLGLAPWNREHQLVRVALQARHVAPSARPPANLVFLIDVSGSMDEPNKLALVKYGLRQLVGSLSARDRVSIVTYAGNSGVALEPTPGSHKSEILQAIDRLEAGGSTNGGAGIERAYALARRHFAAGNVNRVLLATDGDFNVGVTSQSDLVELIQREAKTGVFLSVLGFGDGNYQDSTMEKLADRGNGNYAYIDGPAEAEKVLVEQATGTLLTLAKDVKLQLEFNPTEVAAFRLIGYENRKLEHQDFNDDAKDAGELGADHSVTALYEVVRTGHVGATPAVDPLVFQPPAAAAAAPPGPFKGQLLHVKLRYQPPTGGPSRLLEQTLNEPVRDLDEDFRFAAAVAEFGLLLRDSPHRGQASYSQVLKLAESALGDGPDRKARAQFVELVRKARGLTLKNDTPASP